MSENRNARRGVWAGGPVLTYSNGQSFIRCHHGLRRVENRYAAIEYRQVIGLCCQGHMLGNWVTAVNLWQRSQISEEIRILGQLRRELPSEEAGQLAVALDDQFFGYLLIGIERK